MKTWPGKFMKVRSLSAHSATIQSKIAVLLLAVIPAMSLFYMGTVIGSDTSRLTTLAKLIIYTLTTTIAVSGFLILRKYPNNILKLRQYITTIAWGTLPERIVLDETQCSDDLKYIEDSFNILLCELRNKTAKTAEKCRQEHALKKNINAQVAVLKARLEVLRKQARAEESIKEISACFAATEAIADILQQL